MSEALRGWGGVGGEGTASLQERLASPSKLGLVCSDLDDMEDSSPHQQLEGRSRRAGTAWRDTGQRSVAGAQEGTGPNGSARPGASHLSRQGLSTSALNRWTRRAVCTEA